LGAIQPAGHPAARRQLPRASAAGIVQVEAFGGEPEQTLCGIQEIATARIERFELERIERHRAGENLGGLRASALRDRVERVCSVTK
jgi:hypothetical protein